MIKKTTLLLLLIFSHSSFGEFDYQGNFSLDFKTFTSDDSDKSQEQSLSSYGNFSAKYEKDRYRLVFSTFGRFGFIDPDRNILKVEDAYSEFQLDKNENFVLTTGYKVFNWTALEVFHPVDSVNSRNFDSDFEKFEKIGELTVSLDINFDSSVLSFYYFPLFEKPHYPGDESRLGVGADLDDSYIFGQSDPKSKQAHQWGARYSHTFSGLDISLHYLYQVNRNKSLVGTHRYTLVPIFNILIPLETPLTNYFYYNQNFGLSLQYDVGAGLMFKLEASYLDFKQQDLIYTLNGLDQIEDHGEAAIGLEYTMDHQSGSSSTMFVEYQRLYDLKREQRAKFSTFQNDIALGIRYSLNDIMGSEFLFTVIGDLERSKEYFYNLSFNRRLTSSLKANIAVRIFDAPKKESLPVGLEVLDEDNYLQLGLKYFY
ncbi:hypothetical protein N9O57_01970 [bacterium]|nr:hypothetical protein [bacterium]